MLEHVLNDWYEHPRDCQTTVYVCKCGHREFSQERMLKHTRIGNMDLL